MKKIIYLTTLLCLPLVSCQKDEKTIYDGNAKVTTTLSAESVVLEKGKSGEAALTVSWETTNLNVSGVPSYQVVFSNGEEAESVEVKTSPAEFMGDKLNQILLKIGVKAQQPTEVSVAVKGKLGVKQYLQFSEKKLTATAYEDLELPEFYLVGGATYLGWNADKAQGLYKKENISTIYTYLENNQPFRFLGQQAWSPKNYSIDDPSTKSDYRYFTSVPATITRDGDENMKFSGETGIYKITIDNKAKSLKIDKSTLGYNYANVYIVGSINGWSAAGALAMTKTGDGTFEYTAELKKGDEFKFLGQKDWAELEWGNLSEKGNSGYIAPKGSNDNIVFDGKVGTYKITLNLKAGTYSMEIQ